MAASGRKMDYRESLRNVVFRGVVMPESYLDLSEAIDQFEVRDDDVWIISQPKAGTTWTQEMVWCIGNNLDFKGAKEVIQKRVPFLEHCMLFAKSTDPENVNKCPRYYRESVDYTAEMTSPRFIKSHLPWQLLPNQIQDGTVKPKIIYVSRNAKDSCVSRFYHHKVETGFQGSFNEFSNIFLEDKELFYAPFWPHVLTFWKRRDQPNILFIKYEDMKKDLPSVIKQTATFLGKVLSYEQTATLAQHLSFGSMQKNDAVNYSNFREMIDPQLTHGGYQFMRKGVVGGWKEMMSAEIIKAFDDWSEKHLRGTGLTFEEELR